MKKFKKNTILRTRFMMVLLLVFVLGCETLEEDPTSFISPDKYYTTTAQGETALAASLSFLWNAWTAGTYGNNFRRFQLVSDQFLKQTLVIPETNGDNMWISHYKSIVNLNGVLKSVADGRMNGTQEDIDKLVGQVKFLRAFDYFILVRLFGGIPLYTEASGSPIENPLPRASLEEVYDQIISDLLEAKKFLPVVWPSGQEARMKKYAAQALLTKVYLTRATAPLNQTEYYVQARAEALSIINASENPPRLVQDVHDVFKTENKYSTEMIWSFNSSDIDDAISAKIYGPGEMRGWDDHPASVKMATEWPDQPRKEAYLRTEIIRDGEVLPYQSWSTQSPAIKKWSLPYVTQEEFDTFRNYNNFPVLRYPDVLLMFAEADNRVSGGPTSAAVDAVNQVIDRANGWVDNPDYPRVTAAMSMNEFEEAVLLERHFELCFEYDRLFDLYRKRILDRESPLWIENFSEDDYLWPIPQNDLMQNPLLTQNPGYSSPN